VPTTDFSRKIKMPTIHLVGIFICAMQASINFAQRQELEKNLPR
jgi:hypothetical protein